MATRAKLSGGRYDDGDRCILDTHQERTFMHDAARPFILYEFMDPSRPTRMTFLGRYATFQRAVQALRRRK